MCYQLNLFYGVMSQSYQLNQFFGVCRNDINLTN